MALLKKIIKNDSLETIVKWTGDGTDTLTLDSLVTPSQTLVGTRLVNILAVSTSVSAAGIATITRNSEVVLHMHDNFEFQTDGIISAVLNENNSHPIVVTLAAPGTIIVRLRKIGGFDPYQPV